MSSQVYWDNMFRPFFDHHQFLKELQCATELS